MFDHLGYAVADLEKSRNFYVSALKPLGISVIMELKPDMTGGTYHGLGMGVDRPQFWIGVGPQPATAVHVAFAADSRAKVDAFYHAALAAGGSDNGKPGLRPHYHENYYGAFVRDPDGHNVEAVCHMPG